MPTRKEELAWAAGFFEGEGSFSAEWKAKRKDGSSLRYARAACAQKERALLEQFQRIVGIGKVYGETGNYGGVHVWRTTRKGEVQTLLSLIGNGLSARRLGQAINAIDAEEASHV